MTMSWKFVGSLLLISMTSVISAKPQSRAQELFDVETVLLTSPEFEGKQIEFCLEDECVSVDRSEPVMVPMKGGSADTMYERPKPSQWAVDVGAVIGGATGSVAGKATVKASGSHTKNADGSETTTVKVEIEVSASKGK